MEEAAAGRQMVTSRGTTLLLYFFIIFKCKKNILLHVYIREECIKKHSEYVEEQMVKKIFILISYILFHICTSLEYTPRAQGDQTSWLTNLYG